MPIRRLFLITFFLLLTGTHLRPASADATADARKAIEANYAKMSAAIAKKDVKGFTQFFVNDYVGISKNGERKNKEQIITEITSLYQQAKSVKYLAKVQKFALKNGDAVVTVSSSLTLIILGIMSGKEGKMVANSIEEATWVRSGSGWKLKQETEKSSNMTLDGKPFPFQ